MSAEYTDQNWTGGIHPGQMPWFWSVVRAYLRL